MSGFVSRLFGRGRPGAEEVTADVATAIGAVPDVVARDVVYNHLQYSSGALSGTVEVDGVATFEHVLRVAHDALRMRLGGDADRVVIYLVGRTPDGATVEPEQLGLPQRPTGGDLARRYA